MKNLIAGIISFIFINNLHAQLNFYKDSSLLSLKGKPHSFHSFNYSDYQNHYPVIPYINLHKQKPVDTFVLRLPKPALTYAGKANHLQIYQSKPDNMYVLMPDSFFISELPVADTR